MGYQLGLPAALAKRGLTVETVPGWETRGGSSFNPKGAVSHWTAGARSGDRGSLRICTYGRSDLPGPLCNVFLTRAGSALIVAAGRANHAGRGGYRGLAGNSSVFGTEAESTGSNDWTDEQRWAYPRINAAYCDLGNFDETWLCGHYEWAPGRKSDINDWPMSAMRASVRKLLAGTTDPREDSDMTPAQEAQLNEVLRRLQTLPADVWTSPRLSFAPARVEDQPPVALLATAMTAALDAAAFAGRPDEVVDVDALADAIASRLPAGVDIDALAARLVVVVKPAEA